MLFLVPNIWYSRDSPSALCTQYKKFYGKKKQGMKSWKICINQSAAIIAASILHSVNGKWN